MTFHLVEDSKLVEGDRRVLGTDEDEDQVQVSMRV